MKKPNHGTEQKDTEQKNRAEGVMLYLLPDIRPPLI